MRLLLGLVLALLAIVAGAAGVGFWREGRAAGRAQAELLAAGRQAPPAPTADELAALPPPVARYLRLALGETPPRIRVARWRQVGELRASAQARRWNAFSAEQIVAPGAPGFVWKARVSMPLGSHVRVLDRYVDGRGGVRASVLSAWPVTDESATPELNAGALHRYLAEAVWAPGALLPSAGVRWTPLSDRSALATLADRGHEVALEFRFNAAGEVESVYTPARWGRFEGHYRQARWEGRFRDYRRIDGVLVPHHGEVGWYEGPTWQPVWRGRLEGWTIERAP